MTAGKATPEDAGAAGDGKTDDARAINTLSLRMSYQGGGLITFDPAKRYYITQPIVIYPGISLDGGGATLQTDRNIFFMMTPNPSYNGHAYEASYTSVSAENTQKILVAASIKAAPAAGANVLSVDRTAGFSVGDIICIRLGQNPFDPPEAHITMIAKITAVGSDTIAIDKRFPVQTSLAGVNVQNAMVFKYKYNVDGGTIRGFNFEALGNVDIEGGMWLEWCQNMRLRDLTANRYGGVNMGAGIVSVVRTSGMHAKNLYTFRNANTTGQTSKGRHVGIAYSKDCVFDTMIADNCQSWIAFLEGYCEGIDLKEITYRDSAASTSVKSLIEATVGTVYMVDGLTVETNSAIALDDNGGTYSLGTIRNVSVTTHSAPFPVVGATARYSGIYRFSDEARQFTVDFDRQQWFDFQIQLTSKMYKYVEMPFGVVVETSVFASPNCSGVTGFYKCAEKNNADRRYLISPGEWTNDRFHSGNALFGFTPYSSAADALAPKKYLVSTGAAVSGSLMLRCSVAPFLTIDGVQKTPFKK